MAVMAEVERAAKQAEVPVVPAVPVPNNSALAAQRARDERLRVMTDLEDELMVRSMRVLDGYMAFEEVRPDMTEPPEEWVDKWGEEGAARRLALARVGWMPQQFTPSAFKMAQQYVAGTQRARQTETAATQQLNVQINLPAPTSREHPGPIVYRHKDLDDE